MVTEHRKTDGGNRQGHVVIKVSWVWRQTCYLLYIALWTLTLALPGRMYLLYVCMNDVVRNDNSIKFHLSKLSIGKFSELCALDRRKGPRPLSFQSYKKNELRKLYECRIKRSNLRPAQSSVGVNLIILRIYSENHEITLVEHTLEHVTRGFCGRRYFLALQAKRSKAEKGDLLWTCVWSCVSGDTREADPPSRGGPFCYRPNVRGGLPAHVQNVSRSTVWNLRQSVELVSWQTI